MNKYKKLLIISMVGLILLSYCRYADIPNVLLDLFSQFPFQYALASLVLMSVCLWKKFFPMAVLFGFLFIFNISPIIDIEESLQAAKYTETTFKVYSANIHLHNADLSKLNYELKEIEPDIVLLLEVTPEHFKQIRPVIEKYPYHIEKKSIGEREIGFVFLSKFPILDYHVTKLSEVCNFVLETMLEINQKPVMFFGTHSQRPGIRNFAERKEQFLWLARLINKQLLPVIVAGDLNLTPFSPTFRILLKLSGLRDSRAGFGWQPSWPTYFPLLWIPIDHILVSPNIQVHKRTSGSYIGSDHYPVFAELSI